MVVGDWRSLVEGGERAFAGHSAPDSCGDILSGFDASFRSLAVFSDYCCVCNKNNACTEHGLRPWTCLSGFWQHSPFA